MGMLATQARFCSACFGKQRSLSAMKWVLPKVFVEKSCPLTSDKPKVQVSII